MVETNKPKLNLTDLPDLDAGRGKARMRRRTRGWRWRQRFEATATRTGDIVLGFGAFFGAIMFSPFLAMTGRKPVFCVEQKLGQYGRAFNEYRFNVGPKFLRSLPVGLNLLRGDLTLVGPRPLTPAQGEGITPESFRRMDVRPGVVSLHRLRKQTNIAFESEFSIDAEYVENAGLKSDLGLVARYVTTSWASEEETTYEPVLDLLGVRVDNLTMPEAVDWIVRTAEGDEAKRLCFVNADCMNLTFKHENYAKSLVSSDLVLADGIGVKLAGKILKRPIIQNVNGTDLFPRLCERLASTDLSIYLLGGREGVPDGVADWIERNHPGAKVAGFRNGYFKPEELPQVREEIRASGADILLVAFGAPRQDLWVEEQLAGLGPKVGMGVGGLFDFYSDRIPRAPQWMRELGLEWMFRLIQEPGRMWKRYLVGNSVFLFRVLRYGRKGRRIA